MPGATAWCTARSSEADALRGRSRLVATPREDGGGELRPTSPYPQGLLERALRQPLLGFWYGNAMSAERVVLLEREGHVATITLNRPDRHNAMNLALIESLGRRLEELGEDPELRVGVLTGAGERSFCAGADLAERGGLDKAATRRLRQRIADLMVRFYRLEKPLIAAVNGYALGGGCELALACDFIYAAEHAVFGLPEVTLGIIPGAGGTQRLPQVVGINRARELILTGRRFDAREAERIGLANRVLPQAELLPAARATAATIAANGPVAVRQAKRAINYGASVDIFTGLAYEFDAYEVLMGTEDRLEALAAFREKRQPRYQGR